MERFLKDWLDGITSWRHPLWPVLAVGILISVASAVAQAPEAGQSSAASLEHRKVVALEKIARSLERMERKCR